MADEFFDKLGDLLKKKPWYELPRLLADGRLFQMRTELRKKNLHDTEEPPEPDRKSTRLNSSHTSVSRMPSSA